MYISAKEVMQKLRIHKVTLNNWRKLGKIKYKKINARKFMYDIDSLELENKEFFNKLNVLYARVSNQKQKEDLTSQVNILKTYMSSTGHVINIELTDIASGMNSNRDSFNKLMKLVLDGHVNKVFITYKDRLIRFNFDLIENLFKIYGCEIIIINATKEEDFQQEMTEDLISIIHHFSMKMYSNRRTKLKEMKKVLKNLDK